MKGYEKMITAYLKPTNFCNVGCSHCYLPESVRADKNKMDDVTLHKVMEFLVDMKKSGKHDQVFLLWHGGEPLTLSPKYFENAGKIIDQYFKPEELIESVQTSLIPYTSAMAPIVKQRWGGGLGTSIDFSARLLRGSAKEYQDLWMKKVEMARGDGLVVIPSMTPNKTDCYKAVEIYDWFRERGFWSIALDRYSNVAGDLPEFSSNAEHSMFLIDLFKRAWEDYQKTGYCISVRTIVAAIGGVLYDMPGDRWGGKCQSDFVVINPNGSLNNCPDKDSFEPSYGSLQDGFKSFQSSPLRKKWIRIQATGHRIDECYTCENARWCKSGCPITGNACEINGQRDECSGFKRFITYIRNFKAQSAEHQKFLEGYLNRDFLPKDWLLSDIDGVEFAN